MGHGTRITITSVLVLFLTVFFLAPIITMVAFPLTRDPLFYLTFLLNDEVIGTALANSLVVATVATILSAGLAAFLAYGFTALRFRGDRLLQILLLAPLVVPPFVGAMGLRKLLARYGPLNLWLMENGWIAEPIDFVGTGGVAAIALTQALHFYPVIFLTLVSGLATVDGRGWEAARLLGASRLRIIARIILPAVAPSMLAGCAAVFVWSFADISTPLVFDYRPVLPIQLLELLDEMHVNPYGFWISGLILLLTVGMFLLAKGLLPSTQVSGVKGASVSLRETARGFRSSVMTALFVVCAVGVTCVALLPHLMVILMAIGETWWFTPLPTTISFTPFFDLLSHPLTSTGIKNSVGLSIAATVLNLGIGFMAASVLALKRNTVTHRVFAALIVSPLAVPGLIFALGSLALFSSTILDPRINPLPLLAIGYAIKRLPFSSQTLEAGLLGIDRSGIEAAMLCGANRYTVLRRIVFPQLKPFIVTCAALCFASSMLEVGESFILALKEPFYPITKAMYALLARPDGERMASALGIVSMAVILACLVVAHLSSRRGGITVRHE